MAQKRMFDKSITNSDDFLELPDSSQVLYFHLSMNADDDGFVNNWKSILRMTGTKEDDLKILIAKSFIIPFDTGVIVIKHWRINNYLRNDRYKETKYLEEKRSLKIDKNEEYLLNNDIGIPLVSPDKNSIDKNSIEERREKKPTLEEIDNYIKEKNFNIEAKTFYEYFEANNWKDSKGNKVKSWKQKLITWNSFNSKSTKKTKSEREREVIEKFMKG